MNVDGMGICDTDISIIHYNEQDKYYVVAYGLFMGGVHKK